MLKNEDYMILIVEDSDEDFYIEKRGLEKSGVANHIYRCVDGQDAINFLYHHEPYLDEKMYPRPDVIFLDLNLPKKNGIEVLKQIKQTPHLQKIPVIVLTTSGDNMDVSLSYSAGASSYIQKPIDATLFMEAIQRIKKYWFEIVVLPNE